MDYREEFYENVFTEAEAKGEHIDGIVFNEHKDKFYITWLERELKEARASSFLEIEFLCKTVL